MPNMKIDAETVTYVLQLAKEVMKRSGMTKGEMVERMKQRPAVGDAEKAARWELWWRVSDLHGVISPGDYDRGRKLCMVIYDQGCNDTHIDTMLRFIWRELDAASRVVPKEDPPRVGFGNLEAIKRLDLHKGDIDG